MPTDLDILTLAQWFSPGFPVGAYAYSHGLERDVDTGAVHDACSAQHWIATALTHGAGRNDCIFLAAAYRSDQPETLTEIDAACRAFAASRERIKETDLQGAAFCAITSAIWPSEVQGFCYPVAIGRAARLEGLPLDLTARMYLHSILSALATAAMRLVPLGQTEGQSLIHALTPKVSDIARAAIDTELDAISSTAFLTDIASMNHETQYSRIFRT